VPGAKIRLLPSTLYHCVERKEEGVTELVGAPVHALSGTVA